MKARGSRQRSWTLGKKAGPRSSSWSWPWPSRPPASRKSAVPGVFVARDATWHERAAAAEIRRYLYLTTGELPALREARSFSRVPAGAVAVLEKSGPFARGWGDAAAAAKLAALGPEDYWLKTVPAGSGRAVLVAGGSGPAVLYGAYQLAEKLGVRFSLEGDVVPDGKIAPPAFDLDETGQPLFAVRGIQPFHDFPEGPDWWTLENYKAVLSQLPKLRMNFFGLHTYPENPSKEKGATPNAEPTVWIGRGEDFGPDGKITAAYPASYQNTARGNWGYESKRTGDFHFGASLLFERDDFGNDVMDGLSPDPAGPAAENEVFDRAAAVFKDAFTLARRLGVKTCVGTETPLTVPAPVRERLIASGRDPKDPAVVKDLYKAMFGRIAAAYPVDYYWFWTWEGWTWDDATPEAIEAVTTDLAMGVQAWREAAPPFKLATCGWVLGPPSNRTLFDQVLPKDVAMSTINREVGKAPVDPGFARIEGRSLWAIPWMEDDPALTSPQLWAGRMRRDAADALRYGCDGLLGIHWRTRVLSANVLALARAAWDQGWNTLPKTVADDVGPITGEPVSFEGQKIAGAGARAAVYEDVRDRVFGYHIPVPNGTYAVTLQFVEGSIDRARGRVFDVSVQGRKVLEDFDIFARAGKFRAVDHRVENVVVSDGRLVIDLADRIHYPVARRHRRRRRGLRQEDQLRRPGRPRLRGGRPGDGAPPPRARPLRGLVPGPVRPGGRRRGRGGLRPHRRPPPRPRHLDRRAGQHPARSPRLGRGREVLRVRRRAGRARGPGRRSGEQGALRLLARELPLHARGRPVQLPLGRLQQGRRIGQGGQGRRGPAGRPDERRRCP